MSQVLFMLIIVIILLIIKLLACKKEGENKERKVLHFYLDWRFIGKIVNIGMNSFLRRQQKNDITHGMSNLIKAYTQADDIIIMDEVEFEQNKLLYALFKEKLQESTLHYYKNINEINTLPVIILNAENKTENNYRFYAYCQDNDYINAANNNKYKNFICVKLSSSYTNNEITTLDTSIHLLKIFSQHISLS